jgi:arsenite methyltransferase
MSGSEDIRTVVHGQAIESKSRGCCGDDCCAETATQAHAEAVKAAPAAADTDIRTVVREKYGAIAKQGGTCCDQGTGCSCGCVSDQLSAIGYSSQEAAAIPEGANLGLGCGNPLAYAAARPGETVLDLGSGGGIDCFLAAREVGPTGRVIGVDMTPAMIERARANAAKAGATNVEFRLGEIEHLPVADASVDLVISNCVINLSPGKEQVFSEALRVLRPGGRIVVSDLVLTRPLPPALQQRVDLLVGCVAGASLRDDYLRMMRDAGFTAVEIANESGYDVGVPNLAEGSEEHEALTAVRSVKVRATRP